MPRQVAADHAVGRRRNEIVAVVVGVAGVAGLGRLDDVVRLARGDVVQPERRPVPPVFHRREHGVGGRRRNDARFCMAWVCSLTNTHSGRPATWTLADSQARQPARVRRRGVLERAVVAGARCASRRRPAPGRSSGRPTARRPTSTSTPVVVGLRPAVFGGVVDARWSCAAGPASRATGKVKSA